MDKDVIFQQLKRMDVAAGDVLFVNFDLSEFGRISGFKRKDYLDLLLEYLGEEGTLIALAYTEIKLSFNNKNLPQFTPTTPATTGAFSNIMLKHPAATRSNHPCNSVVAIGKHAKDIINYQNTTMGSYDFIKPIIQLNGKMLLIGCANYPGFLTHTVQVDLGHHKQYWTRHFMKCLDQDGNIYTQKDPGGCSKAFAKLYPYYIQNGKLLAGFVGKAYSLSINAHDAYEIDKTILASKSDYLICENPDCSWCRVERWKTILNLPFYFIKRFARRLMK